MYKELVISIIIVIAIVVGNIVTHNYTKDSVAMINDELNKLRQELLKEEKEQETLDKHVLEIDSKWSEKYKVLAYFTEHDELEKVETQITAVKGNIEIAEYEQSVPELDKCIFILNHIKDKESLMIQNIF